MKSLVNKKTIDVAKALLGKHLIHKTPDGKIVGKIVETEAYLSTDPASHSSRGKTKRNAQMFGPAGKSYVYLVYGMYNCFNVVTNKEGKGEAVLIRALEPISGIEIMKKNRKTENIKNLCSGPGKLCDALGINKKHNGMDLINSNLKIISKDKKKPTIISTTRIGISKGQDLPLRFYIGRNEFISKQ